MRTLFILLLTATLQAGSRGYGDPELSFPDLPSWRERSLLVLTNACRMDPVGYRDKYVGSYSILLPENYPPVDPLYWDVNLARTARNHALDMATNCSLQHNSCNGTLWDARIRSLYKDSPNIGENIAGGSGDPIATMRQWVMDGNPPAVDKSSAAGHRTSIMKSTFREIGTGYAYGPTRYRHYWVQDFGSANSPHVSFPIPSGSHLLNTAGVITFMADFFSSAPPRSASVVLGGTSHAMSLHLGTSQRGTYAISLPRGTGCRYYYFLFVDAQGNSWRYPQGGLLSTTGEGNCTVEYVGPEPVGTGTDVHRSTHPQGSFLLGNDSPSIMVTDMLGRGRAMVRAAEGLTAWNRRMGTNPGVYIMHSGANRVMVPIVP